MAEGFGPMLLLPSILVASLIGGIRVGLKMAVASFLLVVFLSHGTFYFEPRETVILVAFVLTAALALFIIRVLNLTINDLSVPEQRSNTMFRDLHHRVANNLQIVAAVLRQERKTVDRDSPGAQGPGAGDHREPGFPIAGESLVREPSRGDCAG